MLAKSLLLALSPSLLALASPLQIPSHIDLVPRTESGFKPKHGIETVYGSNNFWFGSFDVGRTKNLTLLIDTGSADVILNSGLYKKGPHAVDTNQTFENHYGSTNSDGSGTGVVTGRLYNDTVKFGSLSARQTIGVADPQADGSNLIPADGIIGFAGEEVSAFHGATPFFQSLCNQRKVPECRFGITLGCNRGTQVLGRLDKSLFQGELTTTSIVQEWVIFADLAFNGKPFKKDVLVELDTGTGTIIAPPGEVVSVFEELKIQYFIHKSGDVTTVNGYFPCDQPPNFGISIPSLSNATAAAKADSKLVSHKSSIFNIARDQWVAEDNGNNNCTAIISGTSEITYPGLWVIGQPFFHGHYIDHNVADSTVGFATARI
ncbi:acid protease [Penicillium nucicola]|uniref:acid protease n=1 Tax=Penicillium nucicola TaxID=1850975 RepID=UPI002544D873|nr:acid protease [Penicillium nucicola]KAJ5757802.1 acid protease [Penicillium nucicola]